MKKYGDGFQRQSFVSRNIHICVRHIVNLCKNMNILAIINRNNEYAITTEERYYVQRHAFFKISNSTYTLVDLDGSCSSSKRICFICF